MTNDVVMNAVSLPAYVKPSELHWDDDQQQWYYDLSLLGRQQRVSATERDRLCEIVNEIIKGRLAYHNSGIDPDAALTEAIRRVPPFWVRWPMKAWAYRFTLIQKFAPELAGRYYKWSRTRERPVRF